VKVRTSRPVDSLFTDRDTGLSLVRVVGDYVYSGALSTCPGSPARCRNAARERFVLQMELARMYVTPQR
jgi:hypothetical protein